jgi:hypothetical protein
MRLNPCEKPKVKKKAEYVCKECGQHFSHQSSLSRHKKTCQRAAAGGIEMMKAQLARLQSEIEELKTAPVVATGGPTLVDQSDRSTHNNVRVTNHVTINAPGIRNYGEEDVSFLRGHFGFVLDGMTLKATSEQVIAAMMRAIWSNPAHPENRTVMIPNRKENMPHVKTPAGWEARSEMELYPEMVTRACTELQDTQEHESPQIHERSIRVKTAFDGEAALLENPRATAALLRPILQGNKIHAIEAPPAPAHPI